MDATFVLISHWDMSIYGGILSKMVSLGNVQIRQLAFPGAFFGVLKDNEELILTPILFNLENLLSIKIRAPEVISFFKQGIFPIFFGQSRPVS